MTCIMKSSSKNIKTDEFPDGSVILPTKLHPSPIKMENNSGFKTVIKAAAYIGSFLVDAPTQKDRTEIVYKKLESMRNVVQRKNVLLVISLSGIKVCSETGESVRMAHALRRISYATSDPDYCQFSFLAREPKGQANAQYCHTFITDSPNLAEELNDVVGQAFKLAYSRQKQLVRGGATKTPSFNDIIERQLQKPSLISSAAIYDEERPMDGGFVEDERDSELYGEITGNNCCNNNNGVAEMMEPVADDDNYNLLSADTPQLPLHANKPQFVRREVPQRPPHHRYSLSGDSPGSGSSASRSRRHLPLVPLPSMCHAGATAAYDDTDDLIDEVVLDCTPTGPPLDRFTQPMSMLPSSGGGSAFARPCPSADLCCRFKDGPMAPLPPQRMDSLPPSNERGCGEGESGVGTGATTITTTTSSSSSSSLPASKPRCQPPVSVCAAADCSTSGSSRSMATTTSDGCSDIGCFSAAAVGAATGGAPVAVAPGHCSDGSNTSRSSLVLAANAGDLARWPDKWYQPNIPREVALDLLSRGHVGSFVIRDSSSHCGCYALSVRVSKSDNSSGVIHYLIQRTSTGFRLKGLDKEWPSMKSLVTHLTVMPEMLPCVLVVGTRPHRAQQLQPALQQSSRGVSSSSSSGPHLGPLTASTNPAFCPIDLHHSTSPPAAANNAAASSSDPDDDLDYQRLSDFSSIMADLAMS